MDKKACFSYLIQLMYSVFTDVMRSACGSLAKKLRMSDISGRKAVEGLTNCGVSVTPAFGSDNRILAGSARVGR